MKAKDVFKEIDKIIRNKYRFAKTFCQKTGRSESGYSNTYQRALSGRGVILDNAESILNDLGYELTIKKKDRKEVV